MASETGHMVYIKKILVKNFKSFSGQVKLNMEPGFNVLTGPNGSGKSNIIDAVQFVLGELHTRRMRVSDQSGLIFDGTDEGSQKASVAQVTIYFENTGRGLAIDKNLVSIARRVDRQGISKYFLNGKRTSRRAVLDLLEMAGINPGGYNIVLQGTATRLSDLTPSERMSALESLIGITEYDEKKANAKVKLSEAERKIEVASARIDEVRKRVSELESQRNDAIRERLLKDQEKELLAQKVSYRMTQVEVEAEKIKGQIAEETVEIKRLEEEWAAQVRDRDEAKVRWDEFNREASEKGNTRLPMLRSELVAKRALENSLTSNLKEVESRKLSTLDGIQEKNLAIENLEKEAEAKRAELREKITGEEQLGSEINEKEVQLNELNFKLNKIKETAKSNLLRIEQLTDSIGSNQEIRGGYEIEINRKMVRSSSLNEKIEDNERKKAEIARVVDSLRQTLKKSQELKAGEAKKLEDMLNEIEDQVRRQRSLRSTMYGASKLAKEAEMTVTQFSAKRDLWQRMAINEKAHERIKEMGDAGALKGYYGILRSLIKVDLNYQRAVTASSNGWVSAFVFDDMDTVLECIEQLKKTKLGSTRFLPLKNIRHPEPLPEITDEGIVGSVPELIRYDEKLSPVINLVWGDTIVVKSRSTALKISEKGFRAVTLSGDMYEAQGGITGGFYRRPPDFSKLIPNQESVTSLSSNLRTLRERLTKRMGDLKLSGESLRKFTEFMEESRTNIDSVDNQIEDALENIGRQEKNIKAIEEKNKEIVLELEQEQGLIATLRERKEKALLETERIRAEIQELKEHSVPSDVADLELKINALNNEFIGLQGKRSQLRSDISILTNLVNNFLEIKISESKDQISKWSERVVSLEAEQEETKLHLEEASLEGEEIEAALGKITVDVESTSQVIAQHQKTMRLIEQRLEQNEQKRNALAQKSMQMNLELEKLKLQTELCLKELEGLGFVAKVSTLDVELDQVDRKLSKIRAEISSLGRINYLAEEQYADVVGNYKQMSMRINELEEEKGSILKFIDEVEREKQSHFMKAYNDVCENFSTIFSKLTGGGDGRLELQKPEDPFSGGVDLYVQFPGKPMRLASGASGGERSVAAIAYLLAIQRFLKAPFYLFDEIDAHLDDLNVSKLADVLKDHTTDAQFIVVTLKDVMVHNAERIYGVFNQGGKSRVLALPLKLEVMA